jgi:hypothetical protein
VRRALNLGTAAVVGISLVFNGFRFWVMQTAQFRGDDYRYYYTFARAGIDRGWSRIYDLQLQCKPIPVTESTQHCPALALPPVAWLLAPFAALSYPTGYALWMGMLALAVAAVLILAWGRLPEPRVIYVAAGLGSFPIAYCLYLAQVSILAVLGAALAWRLVAAGRPNWAGVALVLMFAKPHLVLLVPVALAVAGIWRPALTCAAGGLLLAVISGLTLGPQGIADYQHVLRIETGEELNYVYTVAALVGRNLLATGLQVTLAVAALITAWRVRQRPEAVIVAGILGSVLFSSYWHFQDFVVMILAALIQLSLGPKVPANVFAVGVFLAGTPFMVGSTFVPNILQVSAWLALEVAWLVWLGWQASRPEWQRPQRCRAAAHDQPAQGMARGAVAVRIDAGAN